MRVLFGLILFLTAVVSIMFGGICFPIIMGAACCVGGMEFVAMARAKGIQPSSRIVVGMIIAFFVVAGLPGVNELNLPPDWGIQHFPILFTIGLFLSFFRLLFRNQQPPATIADIASTILGFIYVGWLPSHLVLLRNVYPPGVEVVANPLQQPGLAYVWASLFIIWATDVFAYVVGKRFGKHLLYPAISPKKTVEGAVGGLISAIFWATVVVYLADNYLFVKSHPFQGKLMLGPIMGLVVSVGAQLGDLCESLLKRDAGLKDSGNSIPGHGGFLDRGDSMLFGSAICYYWVVVVVLERY